MNDEFSIANPGEEYQNSDLIDLSENLPSRGLIFLAKNNTNLIMVYGMANGTRYVFINFDSSTIKEFWCGVGLGIPKIESIEKIIKHINIYRDKYFGLNSNMITY